MRLFILTLVCIVCTFNLKAQELNCNVLINAQKIQSMEKRRFDDMKKSIQDFMNNRRWTNDAFKNEERINCNLVFTMESVDPSNTRFSATVQVQSSRPVFGTSMESLMLNYIDNDKWEFDFNDGGQIMDFNENSFTTHIVGYVAFYAYIIIGLDYDSYSKGGGMKYLQKAQGIGNFMATAPQKGTGWEAFDGPTSRFHLISNLVNQQFIPVRESMYDYHRLGLDQFQQQPDISRTKTLELLNKISVVRQQNTSSVYLNAFFTTKSAELINIFSDASPTEKQAAATLLLLFDPARAEKYSALQR